MPLPCARVREPRIAGKPRRAKIWVISSPSDERETRAFIFLLDLGSQVVGDIGIPECQTHMIAPASGLALTASAMAPPSIVQRKVQ